MHWSLLGILVPLSSAQAPYVAKYAHIDQVVLTVIEQNSLQQFDMDLTVHPTDNSEFSVRGNSKVFDGDVTFQARAYDNTGVGLIYQSIVHTENIDKNSNENHVVGLVMAALPEYVADPLSLTHEPHFVSGVLNPSAVAPGETITITVLASDPDGDDTALTHTIEQEQASGNPGYLNNLAATQTAGCVQVGGACTWEYETVAADLVTAGGNDLLFRFRVTDADQHEDSMVLEGDIHPDSTTDIGITIENEPPWFTDPVTDGAYPYLLPGQPGMTDSVFGITIHDDADNTVTWAVTIVKVDIATGAVIPVDTAGDCTLARVQVLHIGDNDQTIVGDTGTITGNEDEFEVMYTPNVAYPDPDVKCMITMTLTDGVNAPEEVKFYQRVGVQLPTNYGPQVIVSYISRIDPPDGTAVTYTLVVETSDVTLPNHNVPTAGYAIAGFSADASPVSGEAMTQLNPSTFVYTKAFNSNGLGGSLAVTISQVVGAHTLTVTDAIDIDAYAARRLMELPARQLVTVHTDNPLADTVNLDMVIEIRNGIVSATATVPTAGNGTTPPPTPRMTPPAAHDTNSPLQVVMAIALIGLAGFLFVRWRKNNAATNAAGGALPQHGRATVGSISEGKSMIPVAQPITLY
jgi:LPXTG-motif cell wall-anchored protein